MKPIDNLTRDPLRPEEIQRRFRTKRWQFAGGLGLPGFGGGFTKEIGEWELNGSMVRIGDVPHDPAESAAFWKKFKLRREKADARKAAKDKKKGMGVEFFFRYSQSIAESLGKKDRSALDREIAHFEASFGDAVNRGQTSLGRAMLDEALLRCKEAAAVAAGYDRFVLYGKLERHFDHIREGKVAMTMYEDFMRPVPDDVLAKKKAAHPFFDGFAVMHCYDPKKMARSGMTSEERRKMEGREKPRDPILFGCHEGSDRLWFVADWIDELCDLTFGELVKAMAGLDGADDYGKATLTTK